MHPKFIFRTAVTAADFEGLVPRIYAEAESVSAYGGEELTPLDMVRSLLVLNPIMVFICLVLLKII